MARAQRAFQVVMHVVAITFMAVTLASAAAAVCCICSRGQDFGSARLLHFRDSRIAGLRRMLYVLLR